MLKFLSALALSVVGLFINGFIVMLAFNATITHIFHISNITWMNGVVLLILSQTLFSPQQTIKEIENGI